jgi:hypothetical protein
MKLKFNGIIVLFVVLLAQLSFAQERATGVVSDNAGMPIPGVSISQGTNSGTTDFDGNMQLKLHLIKF